MQAKDFRPFFAANRALESGRFAMTTTQIFVEPNAVVVGLPDEQLVLCHEVCGQAGMRVHNWSDLDVACDKITKLMPQLVIAGASLADDARARLEDTTVAVGAVFIFLAERPDYVAIERQLEGAVAIARERFARKHR
jgi:hypothetical protein